MTLVVRSVFADRFPEGTDLEQAARDSLIRYCSHFGLSYDHRTVHAMHGTRWRSCPAPGAGGNCPPTPHMHQEHPMVSGVRITAEAVPR